jgi:hypothetical protein
MNSGWILFFCIQNLDYVSLNFLFHLSCRTLMLQNFICIYVSTQSHITSPLPGTIYARSTYNFIQQCYSVYSLCYDLFYYILIGVFYLTYLPLRNTKFQPTCTNCNHTKFQATSGRDYYSVILICDSVFTEFPTWPLSSVAPTESPRPISFIRDSDKCIPNP